MSKVTGKSQIAVLEYVKTQDHPVDPTEVGLALYDQTSSCAHLTKTFWSKDQIARAWARKLLNLLVRKGYLERVPPYTHNGYYRVVKK